MTRKPKAPALRDHTRRAIWKKKQQFPKLKIAELAAQFNCTYDQADKAIQDGKNGMFEGKTARRQKRTTEGIGKADEMYMQLYEQAMADLLSDISIRGLELLKGLETAANIRKLCFQIQLEKHLKRHDTGIIRIMCLKLQPSLSEDDFVKLYHESLNDWELEQKEKKKQK